MKKFSVFLVAVVLLAPGFGFKVDQAQAQTATYKFSVFDQVQVANSVSKLDVWSSYGPSMTGVPPTLLGSESVGNKGVIQNWPHNGKWLVKWNDGLTGWSDETGLEKVPVTVPSAYKVGDWVVTTDNVNLRTAPNLSASIYKTVPAGVSCNLKKGPTVADGYNWWNVTCNLPGMTNILLFMAEGTWIEKSNPPAANQPPVISGILGPSTLEIYEGGFWTWTITDPDGDAYNCSKTKWGDGVEDYEDSHFYVQTGSYTITFSCQDAWGAVGTATAMVTVTPSTTGNVPGGVTVGGKAFFKPGINGQPTLSPNQDGQWDLSVIASGVSFTFAVDWGDNSKDSYTPDVTTRGSAKTATHKYSAPGIYSIKFTAIDNASGVKGTAVMKVGVLDPAMLARFAPGTKLRTKEPVMVMQMLGGKDPATNGSYLGPAPDYIPIPELGPKPKYAIGKVDGRSMVGPVTFWGGDWWVRVGFGSPGAGGTTNWTGMVGWVKVSQLDDLCTPLSTEQLAVKQRFAEGECVSLGGGPKGINGLNVRKSTPISNDILTWPESLGQVDRDKQGIIMGGPVEVANLVWWQVSWENGLQGWSAGNWITSDRSKPKATSGGVTLQQNLKILFSPPTWAVLGESVAPNGPVLGQWPAGTAGTISLDPEFLKTGWWYRVQYLPSTEATKYPAWRGWSPEEAFFGGEVPSYLIGTGEVATTTVCASTYAVSERVQVLVPDGSRPFSHSEPPGRNLVGINSLNGSLGTVKSGPQRQNNICWWQVTYDHSSWPSIWTNSNYLSPVGSSSGDGITITSPATQDVWRVGETRTITWTAPANVTKVHIYLATVGLIVLNAPNTGSYTWTIPADVVPKDNYVIIIYSADEGVPMQQVSMPFAIVGESGESSSNFALCDIVRPTDMVNVRSTPGGTTVVGQQPPESQGEIKEGPVTAGGYTWWRVNYQYGVDGWSAEAYLALVSKGSCR